MTPEIYVFLKCKFSNLFLKRESEKNKNLKTKTYPSQCAIILNGMLQYLQIVTGERYPNEITRLSMKVIRTGRVWW